MININILGLLGIMAAILLAMILVAKMQKLQQLQLTVLGLKKSLDEMDEQAKLIVRTDMELNKTQEELDKKLTGLYALQKLSRSIITTLEEKQIFRKIEPECLKDIGVEKALAFLWSQKEKKFLLYLHVGFAENDVRDVLGFIHNKPELFINLINEEKTLSSISASEDHIIKDTIKRVFKVNSFIITPLSPKEGNKGFFFVGIESRDTIITEGDQELIIVLSNQLSQALDNARLFEKTWLAQQELEKKVIERTRELSDALSEVKKASKRKSDFISSVSHELRTPLTSVKGYASILLAGKLGNIPDEIRGRLDKINRHTDELVHLVNDLLDISRIESGRVSMKQEAHDLREIVEQALDLLSVQLKEKELELTVDISKAVNKICVDRSQIERVFINIVANAIKFTPKKGKISITAYKTAQGVEVDIKDTGSGIPREAQEAIFEEFYRVDNAINQEVKGTGLGLALVKHIIEAHKGKIWVRSKEKEGSTFSFTLPESI